MEYHLLIDKQPYVFLSAGDFEITDKSIAALMKVDQDYLQKRLKRKRSDHSTYNIGSPKFLDDRFRFDDLFKFMLENECDAVIENENEEKKVVSCNNEIETVFDKYAQGYDKVIRLQEMFDDEIIELVENSEDGDEMEHNETIKLKEMLEQVFRS